MENQNNTTIESGKVIELMSLLPELKNEVVHKSTEELTLGSEENQSPPDLVSLLNDDNLEKDDLVSDTEKSIKPPDNAEIIIEDDGNKPLPSVDYKSVLKRVMKEGGWSEFDTLEIDGKEVPLEEVELTEDLLTEIILAKQQEKLDQVNQNKIDKEGISEFTAKLIEIEKSGGNVGQALELYQRVQEPIDRIDISTKEGQKKMISMYLRGTGQDQSTANDLINLYESKGELEAKATEGKEVILRTYNQRLEAIEKEAIVENKRREQEATAYKAKVKEQLKTFQLSDNLSKKLVDVVSKNIAEKGIQYEIDNLYSQFRKDPAKVAELALFLTNPEEYKKFVAMEVVRDKTLTTYSTLRLTKKGSGEIIEGRNIKNDQLIDSPFAKPS